MKKQIKNFLFHDRLGVEKIKKIFFPDHDKEKEYLYFHSHFGGEKIKTFFLFWGEKYIFLIFTTGK